MKEYGDNSLEKHIIAAAFRVLVKKNISGTRIHLIAEEADMGTSHIHYYFKTKKGLLMAVLNEIQRRSSERRRNIMAANGDGLSGSLNSFFKSKEVMISNERDYDTVQIDFWVHGLVDEDIRKLCMRSYNIWREDICSALEKHAPDMPPGKRKILACVMVSMMMGASLQFLQDESVFALEEYFAFCLDMVINAI